MAKWLHQFFRVLRQNAIANTEINFVAEVAAELNLVQRERRQNIRDPPPGLRRNRILAPFARGAGEHSEQSENIAAGDGRQATL